MSETVHVVVVFVRLKLFSSKCAAVLLPALLASKETAATTRIHFMYFNPVNILFSDSLVKTYLV